MSLNKKINNNDGFFVSNIHILEKLFNRIYLLSGIGILIFGLINIFKENIFFIFTALMGLFIIYVGIKNIKSEGGVK